MPLDCRKLYPILSQSSTTSKTSSSQAEQGISEQILDKIQHSANGPTKKAYPILVTQSSTPLLSFSQEDHGSSSLDISPLCANQLTESSTKSGDSENAIIANDDSQSVV